ncbi:ABC transporter permease [Paenibacillus sp. 32O-W]|uniref:ABC transporter permease n=1 Tax=Paenibacillus sp. 32O-W TaxID=1695218 RepID=UPI0011A9A3F7|nr:MULTISPECIES: ABC transporter permease [Paenibacillaceae]
MKIIHNRLFPVFVIGLALLVLWETASWYLTEVLDTNMAQSKLPYLHEMAATLFTYSPTLLHEGWSTFMNAGLGFLLGAAVGSLLAIIMSLSVWVERVSFPYIIISQMIPVLGLAPIIYGIVQDENWSRIVIAAYITFFPVNLNLLKGLRSTSPQALELMCSYAARTWSIYWKLRLPNGLPGLFSGLKIAAPLSVTAAILVEMMGAQHGLGVIMLRNLYYGPANTYLFWSTVAAAALTGIINYLIISGLERAMTPWQPAYRNKGGER